MRDPKVKPLPSERRLSRRTLLRGLGAAGAALPFLRSFPAAAGGDFAPKLLIYASPSGFQVGPRGDSGRGYEGWLPGSVPLDGPAVADVPAPASLPYILSPLERHRDDLVFIHGLRGTEPGAHQQAACILTGTGVYADEPQRAAGGDGEFYADGISIDQYVADRIGSRVLGLSYDIAGYQLGEGYMSHLGPNRGFTPIQNPVDAFDRVFGGGLAPDPARVERHARQASVLDRIARDLGALERRLPAADRPRIEEHLEAVRSIEADLVAPAACGAPDAVGSYDARSPANLPRLMRDYARIMVRAMACGYTQVGFLQWGNLEGAFRPQWPEFDCVSSFRDHAISHKFVGEDGAGSDGLSQTEAIQLGQQLQIAYNTVFAETLDLLAATPDVDGRPMLDHTLVLHVKPMGTNHDRNRLFWILGGGAALGVRGGRFLRLELDAPYRHYNDLHVTLAHRMGLGDVERFGDAALNREPIDLG